jgi:Zn-finger nucleic acid-binding protein
MKSVVCPRCTLGPLKQLSFLSGHIRSCDLCEGVLLDRTVTGALFDGRPCRFEPPGPRSLRCALCRVPMTRVQFMEGAPLHACGAHGVWLDRGDRSQLQPAVADQLRRRQKAVGLFELLGDLLSKPFMPSECVEVRAGRPRRGETGCGGACGSGGDASCGGCGGCGGGGD